MEVYGINSSGNSLRRNKSASPDDRDQLELVPTVMAITQESINCDIGGSSMLSNRILIIISEY